MRLFAFSMENWFLASKLLRLLPQAWPVHIGSAQLPKDEMKDAFQNSAVQPRACGADRRQTHGHCQELVSLWWRCSVSICPCLEYLPKE